MRVQNGILKKFSEISDLKTNYLSDLIATRKRPGRKQAQRLSDFASKIGLDIPPIIWLYGSSDEIKIRLNSDGEVEDEKVGERADHVSN